MGLKNALDQAAVDGAGAGTGTGGAEIAVTAEAEVKFVDFDSTITTELWRMKELTDHLSLCLPKLQVIQVLDDHEESLQDDYRGSFQDENLYGTLEDVDWPTRLKEVKVSEHNEFFAYHSN